MPYKGHHHHHYIRFTFTFDKPLCDTLPRFDPEEEDQVLPPHHQRPLRDGRGIAQEGTPSGATPTCRSAAGKTALRHPDRLP